MKAWKPIFVLTVFILLGFGALTWLIIRSYPQEKAVAPPITNVPITNLSLLPYVSPNKTKRFIDYEYTAGTVGYEVEQGNSTYDTDGNRLTASFIVIYDNLLNSPQTYSRAVSGFVDVGCIAAHDTSFRSDPRLFRGSSLNNSMYLSAFGRKQIVITVSGDCQYIGTSDGQFWWYAQ